MKNKLLEKYNSIKNNRAFIGLIILLCPIIAFWLEKEIYSDFNWTRYIIFFSCLEFLGLHLYLDIKKLWNVIYRYRYLIGILLFSILVAFGYHGSSLGLYESHIEPSTQTEYKEPILGKNRAIRSDEWVVSTPFILSQNSVLNNYSKLNVTAAASITNVSFYPKMPTKSISILASPKYLGFMVLPQKNAFSFYWYFNLFAIFFTAFEFFMIITKKNKLWSLVGALLVTFGPSVQWWYSNMLVEIIYSGLGALCLFYYFLKSNNRFHKIMYSVGIGLLGAIFIQILYPAWMVPFAYIYLAFIIWFITKEYKNNKWYDYLSLVIVVCLVIGLILGPSVLSSIDNIKLTMNTVYPGTRFSQGGSGFEHLFDYITSIALPYISFSNASEASQFLSLYPLPIILGLIVIIQNVKQKKFDILLILLEIITIFLSLWNYIKLPRIISKITLLYMSMEQRTTVVVSFSCVILLIYLLTNYKKILSKNTVIYLCFAFIVASFGMYIMLKTYPEVNKKILIYGLIFIISGLIFLTMNYSIMKNKYVLPLSLIFIALISGITVNPLNKGLNVFYEKPVSKKISNILAEDRDAIWASANAPIFYSEYLLANGVKTLNSVHYFPYMKIWNIIDVNRTYEKAWNRYAHVTISLSKEDTTVKLVQNDYIDIALNNSDICKLNIKYLVSSTDGLDEYSDKILTINQIYGNENMFIYENTCA